MTHAKVLTGTHVLLIFLTFFFTVTGVNALMVTYALTSFSGEDVTAAYEKGLNYNQTLVQREAEGRSGYAVAASAQRIVEGATAVTAQVALNGTAAPYDVAVTATLRHPTNAHLDQTVPLVRAAGGDFAATLHGLAAGQWDLVITVQRGGDTVYEARSREWLR